MPKLIPKTAFNFFDATDNVKAYIYQRINKKATPESHCAYHLHR